MAALLGDGERFALDRVGDLVRPLAIEPFVEGDAEAELIGAIVARAVGQLLGRHVGRGADDLIGPRHLGQRLVLVAAAAGGEPDRPRHRPAVGAIGGRHARRVRQIFDLARQPEVDDAHAPVGADEHVVRLEVAVHQARGVRGGQAAPGIAHDGDDVTPRARRLEPALERLPLDVLHGDERLVVDGADVVHRHDVGMRQPRQRLRLAHQALLALAAEEAEAQQLEGDLAIELRIVGEEDHAHAALPDGRNEHVAADAIAGAQPRFPRRLRLGGMGRLAFGLAVVALGHVRPPSVYHHESSERAICDT